MPNTPMTASNDPTQAFNTQGTIIGVESATPGTYTPIVEISDIGDLSESIELKDASHLGSTTKEYIAGKLKEGAELQLSGNWITGAASQTQIRTDLNAGTRRNYRIQWPDQNNTDCTFLAIITNYSIATAQDDKAGFSFSLKIVGDLSFDTYS
ncbi:phage tail tube protein [Litoribrevibacter albus]|uniref:Lambda phage tail tube protein N-terminal domain-containing protein n=1 Tax=Litoribrevibacter albus TaxID=1473156 RepID=A0AA37W7W2_9GAMM|nr:phage tail tube protein [Litoribrevibacter albus]GLQ31664.1 hypothetical protein GCM10007876_21430 [Litoribrevibacter albus]